MLYVLYFSFSLLILNYVASEFFKANIKVKETIGLLILSILLVAYVANNDINQILGAAVFTESFNSLYKASFIAAIQMYYLYLVYKTPLQHSLTIVTTTFIIELVAISISKTLFIDLIHIFELSEYAMSIVISIASNVICFLVWFILTKAIKEYIRTKSFSSLPLFLLPFATVILIIFLMKSNSTSETNLLIILAVILVNYIIIYIYSKNISKLRNDMLNKKLEVERNYYREKLEIQTANYNRSFSFVHDMIYKIKDIKKAIDNNDQVKLNSDVDDLHNKLLKEFNILFTNSKTLSVILNNHLVTLAENNIDIKTNIKCADFTFMEELEITKLLEFLLDYAIDYSKVSSDNERFININSFIKNNNFVIKFIFSCDHNKMSLNDFDDINKIIDKYHGHLFFDYDTEDKYATVSILFDLNTISDYMSIENQFD